MPTTRLFSWGIRSDPRVTPETTRMLRPRTLPCWIAAVVLLGGIAPAAVAGRSEPRIPIVRIGVAPEVVSASIGCSGSWIAGVLGRGVEPEEIPTGSIWTLTAEGDRLQVRDHLGRSRGGGADTLFFAPARSQAGRVELDGRMYRGEFIAFAAGGDRLSVVNVLDLESYLRGVLPAEIGGGKDRFEAIKAQAVAARSYTLAYLNRWKSRGFDLLATVSDQVYLGMAGERPDADRALKETCGIVALHDGWPIEAFYSSTCGGMTATPDEVWGRPARPYLRARRDSPGRGDAAFCEASPYHRWEEQWKGSELEKILRSSLVSVLGAKGPDRWGRLKSIRLERQSKSLRAAEVSIDFEHKSFSVGGDRIRWILRRPGGDPLRSALLLKVQQQRKGGRVTAVKVSGAGYGHGVGLCQMGAIGMAKAGHDYARILRFYYHDIRLMRAYTRWPD